MIEPGVEATRALYELLLWQAEPVLTLIRWKPLLLNSLKGDNEKLRRLAHNFAKSGRLFLWE